MLTSTSEATAVGKHLKEIHGQASDDLLQKFSICTNKFDCLVFEMLFIKELKPSLNGQLI